MNLNKTYKILGKELHSKTDGNGIYGILFLGYDLSEKKNAKGIGFHEINRVYFGADNMLKFYSLKVGQKVTAKFKSRSDGDLYIIDVEIYKEEKENEKRISNNRN